MVFIKPQYRPLMYAVITVALVLAVAGLYRMNNQTASLAYQDDIDVFLDDLYVKLVVRNPERINSAGLEVESYGIEYRNTELSDLTTVHTQETFEIYQQALDILQEYEEGALTEDQAVQKNSLMWALENEIDKEAFLHHDYLIHSQGYHSWVIEFLTRYHPIQDLDGAKEYIQRLSQVQSQISQLMENINIQEAEGIRPPQRIITAVETQIDQIASIESAKDHPLYQVFVSKLEEMEDTTDEEKEELEEEARVIINEEIVPSYDELLALVEDIKMQEIRSPVRENMGVWELPNGEAYYQWKLTDYNNTDMTPEEIHDLGLAKADEIMKEMSVIFDELGYENQTHQEVLRELMRQEPLEGEEEIIASFQRQLERGESIMNEIIEPDLLPIGELEIRNIPDHSILRPYDYYYVRPSPDGAQTGTFYINNQRPQLDWAIETVGFHEGVPGHHLQLAIEIQQENIPAVNQLFRYRGYAEGWAVYGEGLARDFELFDDDYGELGYLRRQLLNAGSSVVDTGIHHHQWTRKEAVDYLSDLMGSNMTAVVDDIIENPGFITAYLVGEVEMYELRDKAEAALGNDFELREFHSVILENGNLPFEILENEVDKYIVNSKE